MKQKIYEIPIWNAFNESKTECPLCSIIEKSENRLINEILTQMTNDPDFSSNLGYNYTFCKQHFFKLYKYYNKSGLALLVEQLLKFNSDSIGNECINKSASVSGNHIHIFGHRSERILPHNDNKHECYICGKLDEYMRSYMEVMMDLWSHNLEFTELYSNSRGFCMEHYHEVMSFASVYINDAGAYKDFTDITFDIQKRNIERLKEELHRFTDNCNYNYIKEPWQDLKDALPRSIQKLTGSFEIK